jgi:hypothetical protein
LNRRVLVAASLLVAVPALLSGCTLANAINPPMDSAIYATPADAAHADSAVALPVWMPPDATTIRLTVDLTDLSKIMTFSMPGPPGEMGHECPPAIAKNTPALDDSWWIPTIATDTKITCAEDGWHLIVVGTQVYAYTP